MKLNIRRPISYDPVKNESYEEIHLDLFVNQTKEYEIALELFETVVQGLKQLLNEYAKNPKVELKHRFSCVKKLGKSDRPLPMPAPPAPETDKKTKEAELEAKAEAIEAEIAKGNKEEAKRVEQRRKAEEQRKADKQAKHEAKKAAQEAKK
jgi:hypothetical protein